MNVELRVPTRISATQLPTARACPLRFLLDSSVPPERRALPSQSPIIYLGIALHGVVQDARGGKAGDPPSRARLEECWRERIAEAEAHAREKGDEDWLPFTESFHRLERLRLRALRLGESQRVRRGAGRGLPSTEAWIESSDGLVVGKIDAIDREGDLVVLRDIKSGAVEDGAVAAEHRCQLIIYAGLYHEANDCWPDRLELVGGDGSRVEVPFAPSEAITLLAECRDALKGLREAIGEKANIADPRAMALARPEGGACRSCQHRPSCPSYMQRLTGLGVVRLDDESFPLVDAFGLIPDGDSPQDGCRSLRLLHEGACRTIDRVMAGPSLERSLVVLEPGDAVAVFGASARRPSTVDPAFERLLPNRCTRAFALGHP